jgi:ABC-type lipoprotein export system ATPase subunit
MIALTGITKQFEVGSQAIRALDDVNLSLGPNEYLAIVGRSGSGKTTLLNVLGCIERPTAGSYQLDGRSLLELDDGALSRLRAQTFGFVFQAFHLLPELSALKNVMLALRYGNVPKSQRLSRAKALLSELRLGARLDHLPAQLSAGERQRVALARALVNHPSVLLADEPTGNLDTATREEVLRLLEAQVALGKTLVIVTHDPEVAARANRRMIMVDGRLRNETC